MEIESVSALGISGSSYYSRRLGQREEDDVKSKGRKEDDVKSKGKKEDDVKSKGRKEDDVKSKGRVAVADGLLRFIRNAMQHFDVKGSGVLRLAPKAVMPRLVIQRRQEVGEWKKADMELLGKLSTLLHMKKMEELEEADREKSSSNETKSDLQDVGPMLEVEDTRDRFRKSSSNKWSRCYGSFDNITVIDPMRFTYNPPTLHAKPCNTIQFFSVKIASIGDGLKWPLDVFGMVAVRDSIDRNRNLLFYRSRNNCQTLTEKDPCLVLSGPSRAVVASTVILDPVFIEIKLKVKGTNHSEDKELSLLAEPLKNSNTNHSKDNDLSLLAEPLPFTYLSNTLMFTFGHIALSVEATIFIQVIDGSWPDGFHGQFSARTSSIDDKKVILLDFGDDNVPVNADGIMNLSRHVVSVEDNGKLKVCLKAWQDDSRAVEEEMVFKAEKAGRSYGTLHFGSCKMKVLVAWSLISPEPEPGIASPEPEPGIASPEPEPGIVSPEDNGDLKVSFKQ